jgi:hypothetical protein
MAPIYNIRDVFEVQMSWLRTISALVLGGRQFHQRRWRSTFGYLQDSTPRARQGYGRLKRARNW